LLLAKSNCSTIQLYSTVDSLQSDAEMITHVNVHKGC